MSFNLLEYYKALSGESTESSGVWHINYDKRHAYKIYSDFDAIDEHNQKINLPPSVSETELIDFFSDKLGQKLNNTEIVDNEDGTESIELKLGDRVVTIIVDQSGSMTWNDNNKFRHEIITDLINKIEINYPGDIKYNLIEYGADIINVLFFGVVENENFDPNDVDSLSTLIKADDKANYDGIRVIRNDDHYPTSIVDGEVVDDGFISRIKDEGLTKGVTYYYAVYTYDNNFKFSEGKRIKVTPQQRIIPRSHSNFRTIVESNDVSEGNSIIGTGVNRDDYTLGIWHMDEGDGKYLYDFSDTNAILEFNKENPTWYEDRFVPAGTSGLFFDGDTDKAEYTDENDDYVIDFNTSNKFTFMGWIYPYDLSKKQVIFGRSSSGEFNYSINISDSGNLSVEFPSEEIEANELTLETYKWQHVAVTYNGDNPSGSQLTFYINGESQSKHSVDNPQTFSETHVIFIANLYQTDLPYRGKITEFSFHSIDRDSDYISSQLISNPILDESGNQIDTEIIGIKDDNGDRLNVFKYDVPRDYNYVGGEVICVKNEEHIPSWEEDGTIIYQQSDPGYGQFFISDPDDFVLDEKYYYRLFTKNDLGNVSFLSDSPSLTVKIRDIEPSDIVGADYRLNLSSAIDPPESPDVGQLITPGDKKTYLRWKQNDPIDSRIERVKIYYSSTEFPVVNRDGGAGGKLVFTGLPDDNKFVHRNIRNNQNAFYTIVNVDKYGRPSNYDSNGVQVENFLHASATPISGANEATFPLIEVNNINYELIDDGAVTIGWDQPQKSIEEINAYLDQTVYIYGAITDEFGDPVPSDILIKMSITPSIDREDQADNVFSTYSLTDFEDIDSYDFFVTRTSDGFFKGILRMTNSVNIISQIKEASFDIQLKALLPKEGGYTPPNDDTKSGNALAEYASLIEELIDGEDSQESESSDNFYEYYSNIIKVNFTNPWEVELTNRDNKLVPQRCYCEKEDKLTGEKSLHLIREFFNGIYMRATNPFVARAKIKYKGSTVGGNLQLAVWDADSSNLCQNACFEGEDPPPPYEGPKLSPSSTVFPPDSTLPIIQGQEETYEGSGEFVDISFVDIPLYAPNLPQAVRLFVKGERAGYSSIKDIYVLFQNILQIDIDTSNESLNIDGKDRAEFRASTFIINPDYPNYEISGSIDESLITYPADLTVVKWNSKFVQTISNEKGESPDPSGIGSIYSTDNVPITNGVYSYTRNGTARNVFMGPLAKGDKSIHEDHEVSASIVYQGLSSSAKVFFTIGPYDPFEFDRTSARFLMEIDGGWKGKLPNQSYGGGGWKTADNWQLWTDGIHYKKVKISRNPRIAIDGTGVDEFAYADCFRQCAFNQDNELLELSSNQIVEVGFGNFSNDTEIEILHGEIYEREDPYTGLHYLEVGEDGFIDKSSAFVSLNSEEISDVTYFYVRMNKFVPEAKLIDNSETCDFPEVRTINDCLCLDSDSEGITECDVPEWSPVMYLRGETTVFLNNNPLVLQGGGQMETGIPPCPIALNEPLRLFVKERKVIDYYYSEDFGNPSNDFLYPVETFVDNNKFLDKNGETVIKHNSDVNIRIEVLWRGDNVPDGTPVYIIVGNNKSSSLFLASRNVYYTTTFGENYSYVDVKINARRYSDVTKTEQVEIFSTYDERGETDRRSNQIFFLTLNKKDKEFEIPELPGDPSVGPATFPTITPYSKTLDRYNISTDTWDQVANMGEARGNGFSGSIGNYIYYMGGLSGNSLNVSNRNERYDVVNDSWSNVTPMSVGRFGGMSVTIGDDIYLIGGIFVNNQSNNNLSVSNTVEVYHADVDMWEELEGLPIVNEGTAFEDQLGVAFGTATHVSISGKNYIYIISGIKKITVNEEQFVISEHNRRILRYCVEDDIWEYSDILRSDELNHYERISPLSIVFDNKIIVFNGAILNNDDYIYPSEDFYIDIRELFTTPSSGEWINISSGFMGDFPEPKFQSAMVEYDLNPSTDHSNYYILGGFNNNSPSLDILEKINAKDNDFIYKSSYIETDPSVDLTALPTGKHGASAEFSDASGSPYIYLMGGYTINRDSDYIDISFDF